MKILFTSVFTSSGSPSSHHHVCRFAHIERAQLVGDAPDFRRIHRDRLERFVVRQSEGSRVPGGVRQVARLVRIVRRECDLHSALVQFAGQTVDRVVTFISLSDRS